MQVTLAAVADYALIDQSQRLSVIGLFDSLGAAAFPVMHPQLFVCLRILCRPIEAGTTHKLTARLADADGSQLVPPLVSNFQVPEQRVPGAPMAVQVVLQMRGVTFRRPGQHAVDIAIDDSAVASIPIFVAQMPRPTPAP